MGAAVHLIMAWSHFFLLVTASAGVSSQYTESHCRDQKQAIVHLFEWSHDAVADECEKVLGPKGYCGVQVSPPNEHIQEGAWWARYQPVSYKLESRSGNRGQFQSMVQRCNAAGVIVIVDAVINHMTGHGSSGQGTGGSGYDGGSESYDGVPFSSMDFHQPYCEINDYGNVNEVRNCYLVSLNDLDGGKDYVRQKIADYFNDLVNIGVSGFRVDASKHMWPGDLEAIQGRVNDVPGGGKPLFFHEVIDMGGEPIGVQEYFGVGKVTEFRYGIKLAECIRGGDFNCLGGIYDQGWGMADGMHAVVYVDNTDQGPPGAGPNSFPNECGNGWTCEHRWSSIMNMVKFANAAVGTGVENWEGGYNYLGFARGNKAFVAMGDLGREFYTGLPDGEYCDIIQDCQQKIQISGGRGYFKAAQDNDP